MNFTRQELAVIFQALCLADAYYADSNRVPPPGFTMPDVNLVRERRESISPLLVRITEESKR